jgi:hypothetical protein
MSWTLRSVIAALVAATAACGSLEVGVGVKGTPLGGGEVYVRYEPEKNTYTVETEKLPGTVTVQPVDSEGNPIGPPLELHPPETTDLPEGATGIELVVEEESGSTEEEGAAPPGSRVSKIGAARLARARFFEHPIRWVGSSGRWYSHLETKGMSSRESDELFRFFKRNRVAVQLPIPRAGMLNVDFVVFVQMIGTDLVLTFYDDAPFQELGVEFRVNGIEYSYDISDSVPTPTAAGWKSRTLSVPFGQIAQSGFNRVEWSAKLRSKNGGAVSEPSGYWELTLP